MQYKLANFLFYRIKSFLHHISHISTLPFQTVIDVTVIAMFVLLKQLKKFVIDFLSD